MLTSYVNSFFKNPITLLVMKHLETFAWVINAANTGQTNTQITRYPIN